LAVSAREIEPAAFGITARTARALADPWRSRILIEVTVRPLSPSSFVEEVGGELTHIARCFRQLAEWGYVEIVEERPGRRHGAAIEHIYRAIRRAYYDSYTWGAIPRAGRDAVTHSILDSYQRQIAEAVKSGTFDQELDRHFSWDVVALDTAAWRELGNHLDQVLDSLAEREHEAKNRLELGNGEPLPATIGLAGFRSPDYPSLKLQAPLRRSPAETGGQNAPYALGPMLAKALSNPWRCKILMEVGIRPMSASQFVEEIGGSMTNVARGFRDLASWGYLELLEERKGGRRGGGIEKIYKSTRRPYFDAPTWEGLPLIVREEMSQWFLRSYFDRVTEALEAGTFDADTDRHLSWKPIILDRPAWVNITEVLDQVLAWLPELENQSRERTDDIESMIPTTIGLAAFRSPGSPIQHF
jgi:DNA-binding transcriptional ArsR family regulator